MLLKDEINETGMGLLAKKSPSSYNHCIRVAIIAQQFAQYLNLRHEQQQLLIHGCYLHDLGKLFIPSSILEREGSLSEEEWHVMKLHASCGGQASQRCRGSLSQEVIDVITHHHERWDGGGYPAGLAGSGIPYFARICAVIDTFDSMLTDRCYRKGLSYEDAIEELRMNSGTQLDPSLVEPFISFTASPSFPMMMYKLSVAI